ncbi:MAG: hypothetical protein ABL973_10195 [Micropepsaceae bacterium]
MKRLPVAIAGLLLLVPPAFGMFAMVPADRVDEVPVDRLLENLERNAQKLPEAQKWRAIGRLHLLAYLRQAAALPVYRERPDSIAEGTVDECARLDAMVQGHGTRENFPIPKLGEMCEVRTYSLGPRREAPGLVDDAPPPANEHLWAAISAYQRARRLEPKNLRTRVALAFGYDRALRPASALQELRFVAREGLRLLPSPSISGQVPSEWEMHVVLSEAQEHLSKVATSWFDRRLAVKLKARLDAAPPAMYITPIVVPLTAQASFRDLVDLQSQVSFDYSGQGLKLKAGWLKPEAAWLVWDPKGKQKITSGFQLFGSVTWVSSWDNGYMALGSLDDNGDGRIAGAELAGLSLWRDLNQNGVSDAGEVKPVSDCDVVSLNYDHARVTQDFWVSASGVTFGSGETRPTYDWQIRPVLSVAELE